MIDPRPERQKRMPSAPCEQAFNRTRVQCFHRISDPVQRTMASRGPTNWPKMPPFALFYVRMCPGKDNDFRRRPVAFIVHYRRFFNTDCSGVLQTVRLGQGALRPGGPPPRATLATLGATPLAWLRSTLGGGPPGQATELIGYIPQAYAWPYGEVVGA